MYLTNLRKQQTILLTLPNKTLDIKALHIDCRYQNTSLEIDNKEYLLCINDNLKLNAFEIHVEGVYKNSVRLGILANSDVGIKKN